MGKSIRSKTKRAFRAKKRTEGVFAAAEAARLQRLNTKLRCLTTATPTTPTGAVGEDVSKKGEQEDDNDDDTDMPGSCFGLSLFGLLDHQDIPLLDVSTSTGAFNGRPFSFTLLPPPICAPNVLMLILVCNTFFSFFL
jgi:hypothetical protein